MLGIRALVLGTVTATFKFVQTEEAFCDNEQNLHLHNLDIFVRLLSIENKSRANAWKALYQRLLLPGRIDPVEPDDANPALHFIRANIQKPTAELLAGLRSASKSLSGFINTRMHPATAMPGLIRVCNSFAKDSLCFFIMRPERDCDPATIGVALEAEAYHRGQATRLGDKVMRVVGMSEVAIMRQCHKELSGDEAQYALVNSADLYDEHYRSQSEKLDISQVPFTQVC